MDNFYLHKINNINVDKSKKRHNNYQQWRNKCSKKPKRRLDIRYQGHQTFSKYLISRFRRESIIEELINKPNVVAWSLNEMQENGKYTQIKSSKKMENNYKTSLNEADLVVCTEFSNQTNFSNNKMFGKIFKGSLKIEKPTEKDIFLYAIKFIKRNVLVAKYTQHNIKSISIFKDDTCLISFCVFEMENYFAINAISHASKLYYDWYFETEEKPKLQSVNTNIANKLAIQSALDNVEKSLEKLFCYADVKDFQNFAQKLSDFANGMQQQDWTKYKLNLFNQIKEEDIQNKKFVLSALILENFIKINK